MTLACLPLMWLSFIYTYLSIYLFTSFPQIWGPRLGTPKNGTPSFWQTPMYTYTGRKNFCQPHNQPLSPQQQNWPLYSAVVTCRHDLLEGAGGCSIPCSYLVGNAGIDPSGDPWNPSPFCQEQPHKHGQASGDVITASCTDG